MTPKIHISKYPIIIFFVFVFLLSYYAAKPYAQVNKQTENGVDSLLDYAIRLYLSGQIDEAVVEFKKIMLIEADNVSAKYYLSRIARDYKQYADILTQGGSLDSIREFSDLNLIVDRETKVYRELIEALEDRVEEVEQILDGQSSADVKQLLGQKDNTILHLETKLKKLNEELRRKEKTLRSLEKENQDVYAQNFEEELSAKNELIDKLRKEVDDYEEMNLEAIDSLNLRKTKIENLEQSIDIFEQNVGHLEKELNSKDDEIERFIRELEQSRRDIETITFNKNIALDEAVEKYEANSRRVVELEKQLNDATKRMADREDIVIVLENKVNLLEKRLAQKDAMIDKQEKSLDEKEVKIDNLNNHLQDLRKNTANTEKQISGQLEKLEGENANLITMNKKLTDQLAEFRNDAALKEKMVINTKEEYEDKLDILKHESRTKLQKVVDENNKELESVKIDYEGQLSELREEFGKADDENNKELESLKNDYEGMLSKLREKLDQLKTEKADLVKLNKREVEQLTMMNTELIDKTKNLKQQTEELVEFKKQSRAEIVKVRSQYEKEIESLEQQAEKSTEKTKQLNEQVEQFQEKLDESQKAKSLAIKEFSEKNTKLTQKIAEKEKNISKLTAQMNTQKKEIEELTGQATRAHGELKELKEKYNKQEKKMVENEKDMKSVAEQLKTTLNKNDGLKKELTQREDKIKQLNAVLKEREKYISKKEKEADQLRKQLGKLNKEIDRVNKDLRRESNLKNGYAKDLAVLKKKFNAKEQELMRLKDETELLKEKHRVQQQLIEEINRVKGAGGPGNYSKLIGRLANAKSELKLAQTRFQRQLLLLDEQREESRQLKTELNQLNLSLTQKNRIDNSGAAKQDRQGQSQSFAFDQKDLSMVEAQLKTLLKNKKVDLKLNNGTIVITVFGDGLFGPGSQDLKNESFSTLNRVAQILNRAYRSYKVSIVGHSDNQPIRRSKWASNFELSVARALSVYHYFINENGINPKRFSVVGKGEFDPIADNDTSEGRKRNRRIEVIIHPQSISSNSESPFDEFKFLKLLNLN